MNLRAGFLVLQKLLTQWPQIASYIGSAGQQQENQLVHGKVSSWSLILWYDIECLLFVLFLHILLQGQAFDAKVVGDVLFESRWELFKVVLQAHREAFKRSSTVKRDHCFFLCGQMLDFLRRLFRRIISRESLPEEYDWDALLGFEFIDAQLLSISHFMEKTEFRTKALRAAKGRINVENQKSKKSRTDVIASAIMGDMFNPHVNQGRTYTRYACTELLKHRTFKYVLVVGLAYLHYSVLFTLPRG